MSLFSTEVIYTVHSGNITSYLCLADTPVYRLVECTPWVRQLLLVSEQFLDRFTEVVPILDISTHFDSVVIFIKSIWESLEMKVDNF